jgi:hypothetical protein
MRTIITALFLIIFSQSAGAWQQTDIKVCFKAIEQGKFLKNFSLESSNTIHYHFFYKEKIYDFYYYRYSNRASCEYLQF